MRHPHPLIFAMTLLFSLLKGSQITGKVFQKDNKAPLLGANVMFVNDNGDQFGASAMRQGATRLIMRLKAIIKLLFLL